MTRTTLSAGRSSIWLAAPKERTAAYFPTYSALSRVIQATLREWVREWFYAHEEEILSRPQTAKPLLVYICTHPFAGRPTNFFSYDLQHKGMLGRALSSAAARMEAELKQLNTEHLAWGIRQHYFPYRAKEIIQDVREHISGLNDLLSVETKIIDAFVLFGVVQARNQRFDIAEEKLHRTLRVQLKRLTSETDLSGRAEDLLQIATIALYRIVHPGESDVYNESVCGQ